MGGDILKRILTLALALVLAAGAAACSKKPAEHEHDGHEEGGAGTAAFMHIHGLGYSRDGKRLLIPVHNGIKVYADGKWSDAPGEKHDYMGFSMAENGFYSSGHPAAGTPYKNPLGLIKSTDEGRSISLLALEGEVDLHGMSVSYRTHTLYVLNPQPNSKMKQQGLHYSKDEGKTWISSRMTGTSGQIAALAVHPSQDSIVALGTAVGTYLSRDYGQTFSLLDSHKQVSSISFTDEGDLLIGSARPAALRKVNPENKQIVTIKIPLQNSDVISYVTGNPVNPAELAVVAESKDVFVSTNEGGDWQQIAKQGQPIDN